MTTAEGFKVFLLLWRGVLGGPVGFLLLQVVVFAHVHAVVEGGFAVRPHALQASTGGNDSPEPHSPIGIAGACRKGATVPHDSAPNVPRRSLPQDSTGNSSIRACVTKTSVTFSLLHHRQQNKCYPPLPKGVYLPISKLHSILAVANLVAHNNISQICYCGQISLQSATVDCSFSDTFRGNIYFAGGGTILFPPLPKVIIYQIWNIIVNIHIC